MAGRFALDVAMVIALTVLIAPRASCIHYRWWLGIIIAPIMTVLISPGLRMDRRNPEKTTLAPSNRDPTNSRFGSDFVLNHGGRHLVMG
jgi:hypothetical protein